ncbi:metallopeptidase family protein [Sphingomonas jeddahensis]|nr:metallopeptidase family protein [Sphingomonas jeddahensis]
MSGQELPGKPPSLAAIERHARGVIERLPAAFRAHLGDVVLVVEEEADEEMLASVGLEHPLELTGVYHGRPVGEKSAFDSGVMPDRIHLYRQAILAEWCETGVRLDDLVAHVTIHEIGHHFGLSDDDMHALEDAVAD